MIAFLVKILVILFNIQGMQVSKIFTDLLDPEIFLSAPEIIVHYGYPLETHYVQTKDGYILTCFRIPFGKGSSSKGQSREPVLLAHPVSMNSIHYLMNSNNSLAFVLADEGFDVWLINHRGSSYSLNHTSLNAEQNEFWDFTFDSLATIDLPDVIDYMLMTTFQERVILIGFSTGGVEILMLLSEKVSYKEKVKIAILLNSSVNMGKSIVLVKVAMALDKMMTWREFPTSIISNSISAVFQILVTRFPFLISEFLLPLISSFNRYTAANKKTLEFSLSTYPASGGSHLYSQLYKFSLETVCHYDYGTEKNQLHYKQMEPPCYNISNVNTKIAIFYSANDAFSLEKNILELAKALPNVVLSYKIPFDLFTHQDVVWSRYSKELVYNKVADIAKHS